MRIHDGMPVIVTGGASGLGAAVAALLATRGARVTVFDASRDGLPAELTGLGCTLRTVDVADEQAVEEAFRGTREAQGQERVLVNCAGVAAPARVCRRDRHTGAIHRLPTASFARLLQVNLIGTFQCAAVSACGMAASPALEGGERGVIINTASIAARDGQVGLVSYAASKAGVAGMTLPLACDLKDFGIRVNTILPGIFDTPMFRRAPEDIRSAMTSPIPFPRRAGFPGEFAQLVEAIVTNPYLNGECIRLDGALRLGMEL